MIDFWSILGAFSTHLVNSNLPDPFDVTNRIIALLKGGHSE